MPSDDRKRDRKRSRDRSRDRDRDRKRDRKDDRKRDDRKDFMSFIIVALVWVRLGSDSPTSTDPVGKRRFKS